MNLFAQHCTRLLIASVFINFAEAAPQIFTDTYAFCDYEFGGKKITFPDKLWTISTRDFVLHYSLCKSGQTTCQKQTSSCLIQKSNHQMINLGHEFTTDEDDDEELTLVSHGAKCPSNPSKNYTLSISLQCSDSIKPKPRLMASEDECAFEVVMMKPDCRPKCTEVVAGAYLLDLRSLRKKIQVEVDSKKFSLSLCGSNRECSSEMSSCEILRSGITPLASVESQHFNYDVSKNQLTARGRFKQGRILRDIQVLLKCNWDTDLANAKYKKVQIQGRHYRFEVESSFGCIKLPQSCFVSSTENLHYDLNKLYKSQGWEVSGFSRGKVLLNVCGSLPQAKGVCSDQHSQVCQVDDKKYINRGSILSSFQSYDDVIKATFVSGSTCVEDPQFLYSTEIEFRCSQIEKGPSFEKFQGCVMFLVWKTPHACPLDYYKGQNCYMNDRVGNRNLQTLYTQSDRIHPLTSNKKTKLIYNLCGAIHQTCNNFTNASFCLKTDNKENVIGFENTELISENGLLRMELKGSTCANNRSQAEVVVQFVCTYETPPPPSVINVREDGCKFNVTIFTQLACLSQEPFNNCTYSTANITYDLSTLTQKKQNYVVRDQNVEYVFNLCGPIVSGPGALCKGNTMVCWKNKTEINVRYKYKSLGGVERPRWLHTSDGLVMESEMGAYCEGLGYYKSVFHFECSKQKFPPVFLSRNNCVYSFKWKTPEACPHDKKCLVPGTKPDTAIQN